MSDRPPPQKRSGPEKRSGHGTRPLGSGSLGQDQQDRRLQGIAPAVVDAFLDAGTKKRQPPSEEVSDLFTAPPEKDLPSFDLPRRPTSLGAFKADPESNEVKSKFKKLKAMADAVREGVEPPPDEPVRGSGTRSLGSGKLNADAAQHLAKRRPQGPGGDRPRSPSGELTNPDIKLQHLAMRAKAKGGNTRDLGKLQKTVEAALGEKGALRLGQSIKALEDKALPGKLSALAESVNKLLPEGSERYAKLGAEVGKQVLQNNLNPLLAISLSVKEVGERLGELEKWDELSNKERVANMAMLTSSMAEILGAVTPPPVNYGIQVMGAGMLLMGMAAEHSEVVEDVAKLGGEKAHKAVSTGMDGASGQIAGRVRQAWDELNDRLATKKKPRLPGQLQNVVDSDMWKSVKKHPVGQQFAEGTENVLYNLARRHEAFTASWDKRLEKLKGLKRGAAPPERPPQDGPGPERRKKPRPRPRPEDD